MNWADFAILGIIGLSVLIGIWRGFIKEIFALAIWIAAGVAAYFFAGRVEGLLEQWVSVPSVRLAIAFVIIFVVALLLGGLVGFLVGKLVESTGLTGTDRMLGLVFGVVRGVLIVVCLVMLAGLTPAPKKDAWWQQSVLLDHFTELAVWAKTKLPDSLAKHFDFEPEEPQIGESVTLDPVES